MRQNGPIINETGPYVEYMDDNFLLLNGGQMPKEVLSKLNSMHPRLTFTMEEEVNGTLNFLNNQGKGHRRVFHENLQEARHPVTIHAFYQLLPD